MFQVGDHVMVKHSTPSGYKNLRGVVVAADTGGASLDIADRSGVTKSGLCFLNEELVRIPKFEVGDLVRVVDVPRRFGEPNWAQAVVGLRGTIRIIHNDHVSIELTDEDLAKFNANTNHTRKFETRMGFCFDEILKSPTETIETSPMRTVHFNPGYPIAIGHWVKLKADARVSDPSLLLSFGFVESFVGQTAVSSIKFVDRKKPVWIRTCDLVPHTPNTDQFPPPASRGDMKHSGMFTSASKTTIKDFI